VKACIIAVSKSAGKSADRRSRARIGDFILRQIEPRTGRCPEPDPTDPAQAATSARSQSKKTERHLTGWESAGFFWQKFLEHSG
jgi:hypothetical protein